VLGARGRRGLARVQRLQQRRHVVGVLLLLLEDLLHQPPRGGVVVSEEADHLQIRLDGDPLRDQVLLDHVDERVALRILRVTSRKQAGRVEVRRAPELADAFGDAVGVHLLLVGVLHELVGDGLVVDPGGHVVVPAVAQRADDLRRQRLVEQADGRLHVAAVRRRHRALHHVLPRAPLDLLHVHHERHRLLGHGKPASRSKCRPEK
jgi:hypothetical protein